ncbi:UNVERIFIED_CONTAM: ToMV resistance protein Tm-2(2) [Sesamum radiatum]|uniref:ToMV resistance protein Tm-2(2) n=1 Tax=Sesamum radiatum TaxID=300843 RepID=A0AAW2S087_SESRA
MVKKIVEEHGGEELQQVPKSSLRPEEDDAIHSSETDDFCGNKSKMVGLEDEICELENLLIHRWPSDRRIVSLVGMAGIKVWSELEKLFPDNKIGSRILLTTRLHGVAVCACSYRVRKRFLNDEESWYLLREKVFDGGRSCPPQLEKAGKKIAKNCEGLPLAIVAVARHLSQAETITEDWEKVAKDEDLAVIGEDEEVSKAVSLSYMYLSYLLKPCFLYTGVFPRDYQIRASKLIKLWCSEGFVEANPTKSLEELAMEYLEDLVSSSVVLDCERSFSTRTKTCRVHSVFRYLCINEAKNNNFFHVINSTTNAGPENIKLHRRLCIHNNALLGIKDVRKSMASSSYLRSLLCTGPHHQYPVRICLDFRFLRVLDALSIRFYKFPIEVVKLLHLRYLAFTYNGKLPASISELKNLRYLIVHQYLRIISSGAYRLYLPRQIWKMQQLRHLEVMGSDLPDPKSMDALLPNLSTLLCISPKSCTRRVFRSMPNLKKLGIQIELAVDAAETSCCFDHLADLHQLESLKCFVVNPNPKLQVVALPNHICFFPLGLKKLTLSGLGFPWECMSSIALLLKLEVLKLQCYAFQGAEWVASHHKFLYLKHLVLEDIDLEYWYADCDSFRSLQGLIVRHCYKLKTIPLGIGEVPTLQMIELVDCNPSAVAAARKILEDQQTLGNYDLQVCVKSSDKDLKVKP